MTHRITINRFLNKQNITWPQSMLFHVLLFLGWLTFPLVMLYSALSMLLALIFAVIRIPFSIIKDLLPSDGSSYEPPPPPSVRSFHETVNSWQADYKFDIEHTQEGKDGGEEDAIATFSSQNGNTVKVQYDNSKHSEASLCIIYKDIYFLTLYQQKKPISEYISLLPETIDLLLADKLKIQVKHYHNKLIACQYAITIGTQLLLAPIESTGYLCSHHVFRCLGVKEATLPANLH